MIRSAVAFRRLSPLFLQQTRNFTLRRNKPPAKFRSFRSAFTLTTSLITLGLCYRYYSDTRASIHPFLSTFFRYFDPEWLHHVAINAGHYGLWPRERVDVEEDDVLNVELCGKIIKNPVGLAAGWDKDGIAIPALFGLGFGAVEVGSVTLRAQPGNTTPRVFRLSADNAVINRYGFPSLGLPSMRTHLRTSSTQKPPHTILGVNLGRNKDTPPASQVDEFREMARATGRWVDYVVINVSSPNTPGLRQTLEQVEKLSELVTAVKEECGKVRGVGDGNDGPSVWLKVSPDLGEEGLKKVGNVALETGVDALVVTNTTISRPSTLKSPPHLITQTGGLSGPPLKPLALNCVRTLYTHTAGRIPIIGSGGIMNADDAIEFARAGACMVQIYTGITVRGLGMVGEMKVELKKRLQEMGVRWMDIVGKEE